MSGTHQPSAFDDISETRLREIFEDADYVADDDIVTTVLLALRLGKPLLVEGPPGAGKTELAKVLSEGLTTELIRLQCYEGLVAENALYEWNYTKQILSVQSRTAGVQGTDGSPASPNDGATPATAAESSVFSEEYLLERPLVRALRAGDDRPPVLLIDEVDRADEEFEALLLEFLSEFQVSIPELGTISTETPPVVVITSNRTRALSDALKRRCLYLYLEPPTADKEAEILRRKVPQLDEAVATSVVRVVQHLRDEPLRKPPGVSETLDWANALAVLDEQTLSTDTVHRTLGTLLKEAEDIERINEETLQSIVDAAEADTTGQPNDEE